MRRRMPRLLEVNKLCAFYGATQVLHDVDFTLDAGHITAILHCERHPEFWEALSLASLNPGDRRELAPGTLSEGWAIMPLTPESSGQEAPPQPPQP